MNYDNYRPISILNSIGKIFEKYISIKLSTYLEKYKIIIDQQYAYQKNKSTTNLLEKLANVINSRLNWCEHVLALSIDMSKAYDVVNHAKLMEALERIGIRGNIAELFNSYLKERSYRVKIENVVSDRIMLDKGIPQGSFLAPLLYIIYVNDVNLCFSKCEFFIYADDNFILSYNKNQKLAESNLQKEFENFQRWTHEKGFTINKEKTKLLHMTTPHTKRSKPEIIFHNIGCTHKNYRSCKCTERIALVDELRYLGITIDKNFLWKEQAQKIANKLRICVWRLSRITESIPSKTMKIIYHALFESVSRYGITVWGSTSEAHLKTIQKLQDKALKCLNKDKFSNIKELYKKEKILTIKQLYEFELISKYRFNISLNEKKHEHNTRKKHNFVIPCYFNKHGERKLEVKIPKLLNKLPDYILEINSKYKFKKELKKYLIEMNN